MRPDFQPPRLVHDPGLRRRAFARPWAAVWFCAGALAMLAGLAMTGRLG